MKIYFVRHGETIASKNGLIEGSSNDINNNSCTKESLLVIKKSADMIAEDIKEIPAEKIFIYSGTQIRHVQTAVEIGDGLISNGIDFNNDNIIYDDRFNGRSYGELEGRKISKVLSTKYMVTHPKHALSVALATMGFKNATKIEPKKQYADKVFSAIYEIVCTHEGTDNAVIFASSSDVFKFMQTDKDIHSMCYFGKEEVPYLTTTKQPYSKEKINPGECKIIEAGMPSYIPSSQRFMPVWENLAFRDYYNQVASQMGFEE